MQDTKIPNQIKHRLFLYQFICLFVAFTLVNNTNSTVYSSDLHHMNELFVDLIHLTMKIDHLNRNKREKNRNQLQFSTNCLNETAFPLMRNRFGIRDLSSIISFVFSTVASHCRIRMLIN